MRSKIWLLYYRYLYQKLFKGLNTSDFKYDDAGYLMPIKVNIKTAEKIVSVLNEKGPRYLYKYRTGTDYDLENLKSNKMWISNPNEFNDPYDNKFIINVEDNFKLLILRTANFLHLTKKHLSKYELKSLLNEILYEASTDMEFEMKEIRKRIFITCLSEKMDSMLMWSHYANYHKGFCLTFDFRKLIEYFGIDLFPIRYSRHLHREKGMYKIISQITTKSADWSYEYEWRINHVYKKNDLYQKGELMDFPTPDSIYMGCQIEPEKEKEIKEICSNHSINLFKMKLSSDGYELIPITIFSWD